MDLGLGNLIELKRRLLPATMLAQTTYDGAVAQIGRGVAGLFDAHCNRQFARLAGAVEQFNAERMNYILSRYPIETITTVEERSDMTSGWIALAVTDLIQNRDDSAGLLQFASVQGIYLDQIRVTYTGGYWYDTTEDGTGVQPVGSTLLPYDVKEAWFLQCQEIWDKRDKLGLSLIAKPETDSAVGKMQLTEITKTMLQGRIRYQMT
jgi:hypothetical protein